MRFLARKPIEQLRAEAALDGEAGALRRSLGGFSLTCFGVGSTIGAGIFVLTGTVAAQHAGPAVVISFVLASVVCLLAGLCYAEFASMVPVAGSAYSYAYATLGEGVAWLVGWCLILEYLFAGSLVAIGWSGYAQSTLQEFGFSLPDALTRSPFSGEGLHRLALTGSLIDLPAVVVTLLCTLILLGGARFSAGINSVMVCLKIIAIVAVTAAGLGHVDPANWMPLVPENAGEFGRYGWSGVLTGTAILFFAFVGFDAVSTMGQEARNPQRTIPMSLIATLAICATLYVLVSLMVTGLADYRTLNVADPIYFALGQAGPALAWAKSLVGGVVVFGLVSVLIVTLLGQTRIFYAMGRDGLIPEAFARVKSRTGSPHVSVLVTGTICALVAGLVPLGILGELISIGTLLAFAVVCLGVLVLRATRPDMPRPFRVPFAPWTPIAGILACGYLMWSLPVDTWIRLFVWLALGTLLYTFYGIRRSKVQAAVRGSAAGVELSVGDGASG